MALFIIHVHGGNLTVTYYHPYHHWYNPTRWEYGRWEFCGKPSSSMVIIIIIIIGNVTSTLTQETSTMTSPLLSITEQRWVPATIFQVLYDAVSGHVESLSQSVIKILTLHRVKKIFFSFYHHKEEIRSFPTMYNTWGFIGWKWAKKIIFSKKMV